MLTLFLTSMNIINNSVSFTSFKGRKINSKKRNLPSYSKKIKKARKKGNLENRWRKESRKNIDNRRQSSRISGGGGTGREWGGRDQAQATRARIVLPLGTNH